MPTPLSPRDAPSATRIRSQTPEVLQPGAPAAATGGGNPTPGRPAAGVAATGSAYVHAPGAEPAPAQKSSRKRNKSEFVQGTSAQREEQPVEPGKKKDLMGVQACGADIEKTQRPVSPPPSRTP